METSEKGLGLSIGITGNPVNSTLEMERLPLGSEDTVKTIKYWLNTLPK